MIIWAVLFIIIVLISLVLAIRSMHDYAEMPVHSEMPYSLYLIKNRAGLDEKILESIDQIINQKRLIVSFERLYKGSKQATVVYGPVVILKQFTEVLDLMELEDYSLKYNNPLPAGILAWEISSKNYQKTEKPILDLIKSPIVLKESEELWWQLVLQPKCEKNGLQPLFKSLFRVVVIADNDNRAGEIKLELDSKVKNTNLSVVPQSYSTAQIIKFYQKRSLPQRVLDKEGGHFVMGLDDVQALLN